VFSIVSISSEYLTREDMDRVVFFANRFFDRYGIEIATTNHFLERCNDSRNGKPVDIHELIGFFKDAVQAQGKIKEIPPGDEAVLFDQKNFINTPFVMKYDRKNNKLEMVEKTIMRKRDFKSPDPKIKF